MLCYIVLGHIVLCLSFCLCLSVTLLSHHLSLANMMFPPTTKRRCRVLGAFFLIVLFFRHTRVYNNVDLTILNHSQNFNTVKYKSLKRNYYHFLLYYCLDVTVSYCGKKYLFRIIAKNYLLSNIWSISLAPSRICLLVTIPSIFSIH